MKTTLKNMLSVLFGIVLLLGSVVLLVVIIGVSLIDFVCRLPFIVVLLSLGGICGLIVKILERKK